jgi:hypothetical protein
MAPLISPRQAYGMKNAEEEEEQQSLGADSIDWLMRGASQSSTNDTMVRCELSIR